MKKVIAWIFAILLCFSILTGCGNKGGSEEDSNGSYICVVERGWNRVVFYDTETHVMYIRTGAGITPLYNADGTLRLYKEE